MTIMDDSRFRRWLDAIFYLPDYSHDPARARIANRLHKVSWALILLSLVNAGAWLLGPNALRGRLVWALPIMLLLMSLVLILLRLRRVNAASSLLLIGSWCFVTLIAVISGGTRAPFFAFYTLIVMGAVIFNGWRAAYLAGLFSIMAGLAMVVLDGAGLIPDPTASPWTAWLTQMSLMVLVTLDAYIIVTDLERSLSKAKTELHERQKTYEQLQRSEWRYRTLVDSFPDVILVTTYDGTALFANNALTNQTGLTIDDLNQPGRAYGVHRDDIAYVAGEIRSLLASDRLSTDVIENRFVDKQGQVHWYSGVITKTHWEDQPVLQTVTRDTTSLKQAEDALQESETRYRLISEMISDYAFAYDIHENETFTSAWITEDSFSRLTGYRWDQIGTTFNLYHPEDANLAQAHVMETVRGRAMSGEYRILTATGEMRWLRIQRRVQWPSSGERPVRFYGAAKDVTDRKEAETRLRLSEYRYRALAENLPNSAAILFDRDLRLVLVDGPEVTNAGYDKQLLEGHVLTEVLPPTFTREAEKNMRATLAGEQFSSMITLGDFIHEYHYVPLKNEQGEIEYGLILAHNVTELHAAQERSRDFQDKLKQLQEVSIELTLIDKLDDLYRRAVELARDRLGFERIGVFLLEDANGAIRGTYGIDHDGKLNDARHIEYPASENRMVRQSQVNGNVSVYVQHDVDLLDENQRVVGYGSVAWVRMSDGDRTIGFVPTDNLISGEALSNDKIEILKLFAATLGQLITRKRAEEALRQSEQRFRTLIETSPDAIIVMDSNTKVLFINDTLESQTGLKKEAVRRQEIASFIHPEDLSRVSEVLESFRQGRPLVNEPFENRMLDRNQNTRWFTASIARTFWDGKPALQVVARDITDRKEAEQAVVNLNVELEYRATQLAILNEIARDVSSLTDLQSTLRQVLDKLQSALPLDAFYVALYDADAELFTFPILFDDGKFYGETPTALSETTLAAQVISTGEPVVVNRTPHELSALAVERPRQTGSGKRSACILMAPLALGERLIGVISVQSYTPQVYESRHIDLLMGAAYQIAIAIDNARLYETLQRELHVREKAEQQVRQLNAELEMRVKRRTNELAELNKELEAFAYSVSHDLRAPLRSIDGFSKMVVETNTANLDEDGHRYLERIRAASQRMGDMIDALLTLSRVTRYDMNYQTVNLTDLANTILDSLQEEDPQRNLERHVESGLHVQGDRRLLQIMLQNLLGNAWKYTRQRSYAKIKVGSRQENGRSVFFVQDNGAGFNEAFSDKLFAVFQRLHSDREFPGTGVGLATVQRIVRRHSGSIWAESQVDAGATFLFELNIRGQESN